MLHREQITQGPPVYITANSLMNNSSLLEATLQIVRDAGADGFELRRELLPPEMHSDEISYLRSQLECFRSPPIYSTPQPLFATEGFQAENIGQVLAEAFALGCSSVKFSPGTLEPGEEDFMKQLSSLQDEFPNITITVENDQNPANGDVEKWVRFFEQATALRCPIWMTFDLGNWSCIGSDAIQAARCLSSYVIYIHAKAVARKGDKCVSQPIRAASVEHAALAHLPVDVPRAIEFPVSAPDHSTLTVTLQTYIMWLRSGNFAT